MWSFLCSKTAEVTPPSTSSGSWFSMVLMERLQAMHLSQQSLCSAYCCDLCPQFCRTPSTILCFWDVSETLCGTGWASVPKSVNFKAEVADLNRTAVAFLYDSTKISSPSDSLLPERLLASLDPPLTSPASGLLLQSPQTVVDVGKCADAKTVLMFVNMTG